MVNTYTAQAQTEPAVTSMSNGNFIVAWQSNGQDGSSDGIFGQVLSESTGKITYLVSVISAKCVF